MSRIAYLDSCVILSKLLLENEHRTSHFFTKSEIENVQCVMTNSVYEECDKKITDSFDYVMNMIKGEIISDFINFLKGKGKTIDDKISKDDINDLENIFIYRYYGPKKMGKKEASKPLKSAIMGIEREMIYFFEEALAKEEVMNIKDVIKEMVNIIQLYLINLKDNYDDLEITDNIKLYNDDFDPLDIEDLEGIRNNKYLRVHKADAIHLATAIKHLEKGDDKIVFVTYDYGLLGVRSKIFLSYGLVCSNPLYALNYV